MATKILEVTDVSVIRAAGGHRLPLERLIRRDARSSSSTGPRYDDWTLPKGKVDPDETPEECALREVREETGFRCELVRPLGCTAYVDRRGRNKVACYWVMEVHQRAVPAGQRGRPHARGCRSPTPIKRLTYDARQDAPRAADLP